MTTFADFVESKLMKDEQVSNIEHYTVMLCDALYMHKKSQELKYHTLATDSPDYHDRRIAEINDNGIDTEFYIQSGRKYHKVMMRDHNSRSVHCFVDKETGDVYKPASIKAPAKGVRYNLLDETQRNYCYAKCDWAGGYLYLR